MELWMMCPSRLTESVDATGRVQPGPHSICLRKWQGNYRSGVFSGYFSQLCGPSVLSPPKSSLVFLLEEQKNGEIRI